MAIIQELGLDLETLSALLKDVRSALEESERSAAEAMKGLEQDRSGLPQTGASARAQLADNAAAALRARQDLERVGAEVGADARRLAQDETRRLEGVEGRAAALGARLESLSQRTQQALRDVDARTSDVGRASAASLAALTALAEGLRQTGVEAALAGADAALQRRADHFADLESALGAMRGDLERAGQETVPAAAQAAATHVREHHTTEVEGRLAAFRIGADEALETFGRAASAAARKLREAERADFARADLVLRTELPEAVRRAVDAGAVPALRRMAEEIARLRLAAGNTAAYLGKEHDPWYPAVRELHLALRGMVGGR